MFYSDTLLGVPVSEKDEVDHTVYLVIFINRLIAAISYNFIQGIQSLR